MRTDMKKVLIERPRYGSSTLCYRSARRISKQTDHTHLPSFQGMRRPHKESGEWKMFDDLIGPLRRFFESRVGCRYDDVWSEVCQQLKGGGTINDHLRGHAKDMVETRTVVVNGEVYVRDSRGRLSPVGRSRFDRLYVDPRDGVIYRATYRADKTKYVRRDGHVYLDLGNGVLDPNIEPHQRHRDPVPDYLRKVIGAEKEAIRVNGLWYWVVFDTVPEPTVERHFHNGEFHERLRHHDRRDFVTNQVVKAGGRVRVGKRAMNSRDLRRHGLVNLAS